MKRFFAVSAVVLVLAVVFSSSACAGELQWVPLGFWMEQRLEVLDVEVKKVDDQSAQIIFTMNREPYDDEAAQFDVQGFSSFRLYDVTIGPDKSQSCKKALEKDMQETLKKALREAEEGDDLQGIRERAKWDCERRYFRCLRAFYHKKGLVKSIIFHEPCSIPHFMDVDIEIRPEGGCDLRLEKIDGKKVIFLIQKMSAEEDRLEAQVAAGLISSFSPGEEFSAEARKGAFLIRFPLQTQPTKPKLLAQVSWQDGDKWRPKRPKLESCKSQKVEDGYLVGEFLAPKNATALIWVVVVAEDGKERLLVSPKDPFCRLSKGEAAFEFLYDVRTGEFKPVR